MTSMKRGRFAQALGRDNGLRCYGHVKSFSVKGELERPLLTSRSRRFRLHNAVLLGKSPLT